MLVRFIDGPSKGMTRDVPFLTAQTLFARQIAVDERLVRVTRPESTSAPQPEAQAVPQVQTLDPPPTHRPGRKDRSK
jgi:hypothetical protein